MSWIAQAPSNIALIKYMGKKDSDNNIPDNSSLSYTLINLLSTVKLQCIDGEKDVWEPLSTPDAFDCILSMEGMSRFINHLQRIKSHFAYDGCFLIQSSNNFPSGSGLASSASSFAALTKCAVMSLSELSQKKIPSIDEQSRISRKGSGSSCRSFYSPWALWNGNQVEAIDLPYKVLAHQVIVISDKEKKVSSSKAHSRIKTSAFYEGRPQRAEENLQALLNAFYDKNWAKAYQICWDEFQDMHQLFRTCENGFSYITKDSLTILNTLQNIWEQNGDGPIVTMDAGPNIHLLYRPDQAEIADQFKKKYLIGKYYII